jgi:hypothetical protein
VLFWIRRLYLDAALALNFLDTHLLFTNSYGISEFLQTLNYVIRSHITDASHLWGVFNVLGSSPQEERDSVTMSLRLLALFQQIITRNIVEDRRYFFCQNFWQRSAIFILPLSRFCIFLIKHPNYLQLDICIEMDAHWTQGIPCNACQIFGYLFIDLFWINIVVNMCLNLNDLVDAAF